MENPEVDCEEADKKLVLDLVLSSTIPLLYMTEDTQKDIDID